MTKTLQIADNPQAPLTPQQKRFNQLVKRIEAGRARLEVLQRDVPLFEHAYHTQAQPLLDELLQCQLQMVDKLDALLAKRAKAKDGGWTATQRRTMKEVLSDMASGLIEEDRLPEAQAAHLKTLHDRHADVDFDTGKEHALEEMKQVFEHFTGVDLGDRTFESPDDLLRHAQQQMQQKMQAAQNEAEPVSSAHASRAEQKRRRQQERQQEKQQAKDQEASQSVREVFRKLASALHPDRAADEADRIERTAMMQRVNQAYNKQDLLALFALQLEIEQVDVEHLARATAEKAAHYNRLLADQLAELEAEIDATEQRLRMQFPPLRNQRLDPARFGKVLQQMLSSLRGDLMQARRDLRLMDDPRAARQWLNEMRRELDAEASMGGFGFPF